MSVRTLLDIELARLYFEVLVDFAKTQPGKTIQYAQVVQMANDRFPNNPYLKSAIPTSMGRRLDALREFTAQKKIPDLSSLVVNKITGDNGEGFKKSFDGEGIRQQVSVFNWSEVKIDFDTYLISEKLALEDREKKIHKPKKISDLEARELWWRYFKEHRKEVGLISNDTKEKIIAHIVNCQSPSDALSAVNNSGSLPINSHLT